METVTPSVVGPDVLRAVSETCPTPVYVYDLDVVRARIAALAEAFGGRFGVSYAVKANPNRRLLRAIAPQVQAFDVSSFAEVVRLSEAGADGPITFTGPGKRDEELRRFAALGRGAVVLESLDEAEALSQVARRHGARPQPVLIRVNPRRAARQAGASMSGRGSQFGVDEEEIGPALAALGHLPGLRLVGFHCYPATNMLRAEAVAENLHGMAALFRACAAQAGIRPETLVFGAGFGIPYFEGEAELDLAAVAAAAAPALDALRADPACGGARLLLELGRWIVGPAGVLLTTVVRAKTSRGTAIRICDAGFNANMAACGMLGGAFRRNWRIANLSNPHGPPEPCDLVGPLCTTLDHVATGIVLPQVRKGDVLAVPFSGAYGVTASPTRFISHPEPGEVLVEGGRIFDATESRLNWWPETAAEVA